MFNFDFSGAIGTYESRKVANWTSPDGTKMVSTAAVTDGEHPYETAFEHPAYNDGKMVIVEAYDTREQAQTGHDKWLKVMQEGPLPDKLIDCCNAGIAQFGSMVGGDDWRTFPRDDAKVTP